MVARKLESDSGPRRQGNVELQTDLLNVDVIRGFLFFTVTDLDNLYNQQTSLVATSHPETSSQARSRNPRCLERRCR